MSGNKHAVNSAAVNDGSLLLQTVAVTLVAACSIAADSTYVHVTTVEAPTTAGFEAGALQHHSADKLMYGVSSFSDNGGVTKFATAVASAGTAQITKSQVLPTGAGGFFDCDATIDATIHPKLHSYATPLATAAVEVVGNTWQNKFVRGPYDIVDNQPTVDFIAAPMVQLSGETTYTHAANTYAVPDAQFTFSVGGVSVFIGDWHPFGGVTVEAQASKTIRMNALVEADGTMTANINTHFIIDSESFPGDATISSPALRRALPTASLPMDANFNPVFARIRHYVDTSLTGDAVTTVSNVLMTRSGGFLTLAGTAVVDEASLVLSRATANMTGDATTSALSFKWRVRFAETDIVQPATFLLASAYIHGFDTDVITRPAEIKDFTHPAELKDFTRGLG